MSEGSSPTGLDPSLCLHSLEGMEGEFSEIRLEEQGVVG